MPVVANVCVNENVCCGARLVVMVNVTSTCSDFGSTIDRSSFTFCRAAAPVLVALAAASKDWGRFKLQSGQRNGPDQARGTLRQRKRRRWIFNHCAGRIDDFEPHRIVPGLRAGRLPRP